MYIAERVAEDFLTQNRKRLNRQDVCEEKNVCVRQTLFAKNYTQKNEDEEDEDEVKKDLL